MDGLPEHKNAYPDKRNSRGSITGARGYHKAWLRGWREADQKLTREATVAACA